MNTKIEQQDSKRLLWLEVFRILEVARSKASSEDVLDRCLNARTKDLKSVSQLYKLARLYFELQVRETICSACLEFLEGEGNMSPEDLEKLQHPDPPTKGIFDDMENWQ